MHTKAIGEQVEMPVCSHSKTKSAYELIGDKNLDDLETLRKTHDMQIW